MDTNRPMHLEKMTSRKFEGAKVLAVTSGKGGVGKTNIAANLSICLAASNKKVVVLDADLGLGNLDVLMNINSGYNVWHMMSGHKSLEEIICTGPCGVEVICGGSGFEELANLSPFQRERLIHELDELQNSRDVIVIDTGAGINASVLGFCQAADHTVVVTTPEPTAMTDAYAMIKVLSGRGYAGRISVVVNMVSSITEGKKVYRHIADVAKRFLNVAIYEAGVLCKDEILSAAVCKREPVVLGHPKSKITSSIVAMSARLWEGSTASSRSESFFQKVANWFF
jgi:flagellar biosynthesis protein FlhG